MRFILLLEQIKKSEFKTNNECLTVKLPLLHLRDMHLQFLFIWLIVCHGLCIIPKRTHILIHVIEVHFDHDKFGDPDQLKPEQLLSNDGKRLIKSDEVIAFGLGKQSCL